MGGEKINIVNNNTGFGDRLQRNIISLRIIKSWEKYVVKYDVCRSLAENLKSLSKWLELVSMYVIPFHWWKILDKFLK